jgi:hypothetical protein
MSFGLTVRQPTLAIALAATMGVALAPAAALAQAAQVFDRVLVRVNGKVVVNFNANAENGGQEVFTALQVGPVNPNFVAGTIFLTEPVAEQGTGSEITSLGNTDVSAFHVSDALSINASNLTGLFNVQFISDGASTTDLNNFPIYRRQPNNTVGTVAERNGWINVTSYYSVPATVQIFVRSDAAAGHGVSAPEPASWAMMLLGLGGLGAALRARRRVLTA